ncbi:hypothetical protein BDV38DRAFT_278320 [Aspergillus pseudotamarii]|uniref:Uncharacterized protein n=1 Tax=Aspergillus pseudotamarii TaxID=132259 RepID=A0A5N6T728_ASPPS|nr:uncharacterized protein BDV38DRAFT_278320 [Aspergillus pseudotamarii]KAE8142145.1 hypothetical protein BDV38DRAFT_278320 [Aspergillus pseudotamarii]
MGIKLVKDDAHTLAVQRYMQGWYHREKADNKCTPDSPVCGASGTRRKNQKIFDARVKLVPPREVDIPSTYSSLHSWSKEI